MIAPPLEWAIDVNAISHAPADFSYEANKGELAALRRYAEVEDLRSFKSRLTVVPLTGGKFRVSGILQADVIQASVVNLAIVPASIEESFSIEYWPPDLIQTRGEVAEAFNEDQPEPIADGRLPIGELLSELLAVSIDPYPRNEGDTFEWTPANPEPEAGPFADLARLRRQKDTDKR
jgi:hypothetical protein